MIGVFDDYQTARLMQASSSYLTDLQVSFLGIYQSLTPIFSIFLTPIFLPMRAYEKTGGNPPAQITLYVDRQTCGTCKQYLPELMHEMKIDTVNVVMKNGQRVTIDSRAR